jgi:hypothetical protein
MWASRETKELYEHISVPDPGTEKLLNDAPRHVRSNPELLERLRKASGEGTQREPAADTGRIVWGTMRRLGIAASLLVLTSDDIRRKQACVPI